MIKNNKFKLFFFFNLNKNPPLLAKLNSRHALPSEPDVEAVERGGGEEEAWIVFLISINFKVLKTFYGENVNLNNEKTNKVSRKQNFNKTFY